MPSVKNLRRLVLLKHHPSAILLAVQLVGILLYPLLDQLASGRLLLAAFGLLVLGAALQVVRSSPWLTGLAGVLALLTIGLHGITALWPSTHLDIAAAAMLSAFYFYAAGGLIAYMLQDQVASLDEFFAVGATFTLLAWAFAHLYAVCQALAPGSFGAMMNPQDPRTWMELLFLSFTTLSGVGLGDIIPLTPIGRSLVMLEQLAGVMYIALVVSRLISISAARRDTRG